MANDHSANRAAQTYQIRLKGHLSQGWADWFEGLTTGLTIVLEAGGTTLLTASLADQSALHGVLRKVRDLGMPLLSVERVDAEPACIERSDDRP